MTRDEILNMPTGRGMDTLTALYVMGWGKRVTVLSGLEIYVNKETGKDAIGVDLWQPSKFIVYAWQLIEKHPHYVSLVRSNETGWQPAPWGPMLWRCRFYAPEKFEAKAETAPLAICRAALLAVMDL